MGRKMLKTSYIVTIERNQKAQINIYCRKQTGEELGSLFATYYLKCNRVETAYENSVHLEHIYVEKKYRKKGLGKQMMVALLEELKRIESTEYASFRFLFGEVGKSGKDNPKSSLPFYASLDGIGYGMQKHLSYRLCKGAAMDGLDQFYYYIVDAN